MGVSPVHENSVGLVRNLTTHRISPQFHLIYDEDFQTVCSNEENQPLLWEELVVFDSIKSDYDEDQNVPELNKEWLDESELRKRVEEEKKSIGGCKGISL